MVIVGKGYSGDFDFSLCYYCFKGAVFSVTFILMGLNLWAALIVMLIVVMIIVHMIGCMAIAGINANAVSLVNLVMVSHDMMLYQEHCYNCALVFSRLLGFLLNSVPTLCAGSVPVLSPPVTHVLTLPWPTWVPL